ncbi:GSK3-beta interaction protein [Atheta coriaria]|uniref:GSK3-beta interaction protein n=1 Tax=Dalotia coriaria TaxID=877792 RepID=UPI0031F3C683
MQKAGNWRAEADAVIRDIDQHVKTAKVSMSLASSASRIFLNVTTMENQAYCVELSGKGFRVVGKSYDSQDAPEDKYFETPYSLLSAISPLYNDSFGQELMKKLSKLADK